jgi:hypothetical protein
MELSGQRSALLGASGPAVNRHSHTLVPPATSRTPVARSARKVIAPQHGWAAGQGRRAIGGCRGGSSSTSGAAAGLGWGGARRRGAGVLRPQGGSLTSSAGNACNHLWRDVWQSAAHSAHTTLVCRAPSINAPHLAPICWPWRRRAALGRSAAVPGRCISVLPHSGRWQRAQRRPAAAFSHASSSSSPRSPPRSPWPPTTRWLIWRPSCRSGTPAE